jgi:hypothetical protein
VLEEKQDTVQEHDSKKKKGKICVSVNINYLSSPVEKVRVQVRNRCISVKRGIKSTIVQMYLQLLARQWQDDSIA